MHGPSRQLGSVRLQAGCCEEDDRADVDDRANACHRLRIAGAVRRVHLCSSAVLSAVCDAQRPVRDAAGSLSRAVPRRVFDGAVASPASAFQAHGAFAGARRLPLARDVRGACRPASPRPTPAFPVASLPRQALRGLLLDGTVWRSLLVRGAPARPAPVTDKPSMTRAKQTSATWPIRRAAGRAQGRSMRVSGGDSGWQPQWRPPRAWRACPTHCCPQAGIGMPFQRLRPASPRTRPGCGCPGCSDVDASWCGTILAT